MTPIKLKQLRTWKLIVPAILLLTGCTVIQVTPVDSRKYEVKKICIEPNEKVTQVEFLTMIEQSFAKHGIASERYTGKPPDSCEFTSSYVAHWNWDIAYYLTDADIAIRRGAEVIGHAVYHLRNKGGLALSKWASARSKMEPVLDQLLAQFSVNSNGSEPDSAADTPAATPSESASSISY